jgi:hypothetical protein
MGITVVVKLWASEWRHDEEPRSTDDHAYTGTQPVRLVVRNHRAMPRAQALGSMAVFTQRRTFCARIVFC